tara:strand:- start:85 stop:228 length:144 start_codon:yes stop_codon:yes gene_type:complete
VTLQPVSVQLAKFAGGLMVCGGDALKLTDRDQDPTVLKRPYAGGRDL